MSAKRTAITNWFNSEQEYSQGVSLYCVWGDNLQLKNLFVKGSTDYTKRRLPEELEAILQADNTSNTEQELPDPIQAPEAPKNAELEKACNDRAMQLWKQMMNDRAILFNLTKLDDINIADLVEKRRVLALKICACNYDVSKAYDELAYVRLHGHLPEEVKKEQPSTADIADTDVKAVIDNLRKNISKLKKREQSPQRISLIQQHQQTLTTLLERWNQIKSCSKNKAKK